MIWKSIKQPLKILLKQVLKVFWILPVDQNVVLFESMEGSQYSCSPKYVSKMLHEVNPSAKIRWYFKRNIEKKTPDYVSAENGGKLKKLLLEMTSGIIVTNQNVLGYIPFRKKQLVINTWHGGGAYKKVHGSSKTFELCANNTSYILSSSKAFSDFFLKKDFQYQENKIVKCGMPRNDLLQVVCKQRVEKIRESLKIHNDDFIILYAPTFRGNSNHMEAWKMDIDFSMIQQEIETKFGRKCEILVRAHVGDDVFSRHKVGIRDVSQYDDMQELLCITDLLITDYSSCVWDRAVQKGMGILYATDVDEYRRYPGLYTDITTWPFPLAQNNEELKQELRKLDAEKQAESCEKHLQELGSYETGHATEQVVEIIENHLKGNKS